MHLEKPLAKLPMPGEEVAGMIHVVLLSSAASGWSDLFISSFRMTAQPEMSAVPEPMLAWHTLYLHIRGGPTDLRCDFAGHKERGLTYPGYWCLQPAQVPSAYSWNTSADLLHLDLTPSLINATAAEISPTDPVRLELIPRFFNFKTR
jgi:hypothetical protein